MRGSTIGWVLAVALVLSACADDDEDGPPGDTLEADGQTVDDAASTSSDASKTTGDAVGDTTASADTTSPVDTGPVDAAMPEQCLLCVDIDTCLGSGGGIGSAACPAGFVCCEL